MHFLSSFPSFFFVLHFFSILLVWSVTYHILSFSQCFGEVASVVNWDTWCAMLKQFIELKFYNISSYTAVVESICIYCGKQYCRNSLLFKSKEITNFFFWWWWILNMFITLTFLWQLQLFLASFQCQYYLVKPFIQVISSLLTAILSTYFPLAKLLSMRCKCGPN